VDARYRTRADPAHTAVVGSSMGGLISLYAALSRPDVFGRAGVFSCACWISRRETLAFVAAAKPGSTPPRLYFVIGGSETADGEPARDQAAVVDSLLAAGFPRTAIVARVVPEGKHAEWFWRREFPAAYRWLLAPAAPPGR
jgi:metallo-beta-lactamase class B